MHFEKGHFDKGHFEKAPAGHAPTDKAAAPPTRKRRMGAGGKLLAALSQLAQEKGRFVSHCERNWASITFAGTRHRVVLEFRGDDAVEAGECFIAFLPEHEFAISGQLVADAAVTEVDHAVDPNCLTVTCELLLLEEG